MNERQLGHFIKQSLNQGIVADESIPARLAQAREAALANQRATAASPILAWAGNNAIASGPRHLIPRLVLPAMLLAAGLFSVGYWYQAQQNDEAVEIDAAVLLGDLPLDAYLDKGFGAWLKSSSEE